MTDDMLTGYYFTETCSVLDAMVAKGIALHSMTDEQAAAALIEFYSLDNMKAADKAQLPAVVAKWRLLKA